MHSKAARETSTSGIPGLRGLDHVGFTVPSIDDAIDFFVRVIGCEVIYSLGPIAATDDWMREHLNVDPQAIIKRLSLLRCGHGSNFEIFEYAAPERNERQPRNSDIGGHHLAFYVDDMATAISHLKTRAVRVLGEPTVRTTGPSAGQTWVYFLAPWGMQLELVCFPKGKAYERETSRRLWNPCRPEQ